MVNSLLSRRAWLAFTASAVAMPKSAFAEEFIDLNWEDLLPGDQSSALKALRGLVEHDQLNLSARQPTSSGVRTDWNGMTVRLPGFIVPIEYDGVGVSAFILVPYVGACVHVPPPPANQLVLVTTSKPYESQGLFEPVNVIGMFGTAATMTHLAEIGYALSADQIEPYA